MKTLFFYLLVALPATGLFAQLAEDFTDGNLSSDPTWFGTLTDWKVNDAGQLQSANTTANSTFYLSTANTLATSAQWEFTLRLQFNTSSANYTDVFLIASAADLTAPSTTGYFVRIGNTQDDISLYRKDAGSLIKIIDGTDGITNTSNNTLRIKVVRNTAGIFVLYRDATGTGNSFIVEGSATDATYTTGTHFGLLVRQSTSSFFQKHYFDDISVMPIITDVTPPAIQSITVLSSTSIDVLFSEPLDRVSGESISNYDVNSIGAPVSAKLDLTNLSLTHLVFPKAFTSGLTHTLTVTSIKDVAGNTLISGTGTFSHYTPKRFDVVIDEIMADPSPEVGLPNIEYIELKNTSNRSLNLEGWRLTTPTGISNPFPPYTLPADSFLIVSSTSAAAQFPTYLRVLGVSNFPSLLNDGSLLTLRSKEQTLIHTVAYQKQWYGNAEKEEGGWSLEMIDPLSPCTGASNWKASTHSNGGTPGQKNSVDAIHKDEAAPVLLQVYPVSKDTIALVFDEPLDSTSVATLINYTISNNRFTNIQVEAPLFNKVYLRLETPLRPSTIYTITARSILDCKSNGGSVDHTANTGWPDTAAASDVVINEILFDPKPNGEDYLELYNKSQKLIDTKDLFIASRNSTGTLASKKPLTTTSFHLTPGSYIVLTENKASLPLLYHVKNPEAVIEVAALPSFPNDKGTVVLLNRLDEIIDEVQYDADWHFDLIANPEGVSLERLDPTRLSQDASNWHSAASTSGYGTPGYQNSQYKKTEESSATINITPKVFSPDNDGHDDIAIIQYNLKEAGWVASLTLFNAKGVMVRHLVKNGTLGLKGNWTWDGLNEQQQKLPTGTYIIFIELFNLQGKKEQYKKTIVLAKNHD